MIQVEDSHTFGMEKDLRISVTQGWVQSFLAQEVSLNMDNFVALWMGGAPSDLIIAHFLAMVIGYAHSAGELLV